MTEFQSRLADGVASAQVTISSETADALETYFDLLKRWNRRMNLTSLRLEPLSDEALDRLFLEPLSASHYIEDAVRATTQPVWFDLGSGGGSPAIPLNIVHPDWRLTMVESRARKAAFLSEAVRTLSLYHATVRNSRFEELARPDEAADLVTVRAVRADELLKATVSRLIGQNGTFAVFGAASADEEEGWEVVRTIQLLPANPSSRLELVRSVPRGTNRLTSI